MHEVRPTTRRSPIGLAALAVAALLCLALAPGAHAKVFEVDSTADKGDTSPGNGKCRASNGKCTLRAAFEEAGATAAPDKALLKRADYRVKEPLVAEGPGSLTVIGKGPFGEGTSIDGRGKTRVLFIDSEAKLVLKKLFVKGGAISPSALREGSGRGFSFPLGGAGALVAPDGKLKIDRVRLVQNVAKGSNFDRRGGATMFGAGVLNFSKFSSRKSEIQNNRIEGYGGGVFTGPGASTDLHNTRVHSNFADRSDGGLGAQGETEGPKRDASGESARRGFRFPGVGPAEIKVIRSSITSNSTESGPAAIGASATSLRIIQSTVGENVSDLDRSQPTAAIELDYFSDALIQHSTIAVNNAPRENDERTARKRGFQDGAANIESVDSFIDIENSIVADGRLGGSLRNCIDWGIGGIFTLGYNLSDDTSCGFLGESDIQNADPFLDELRRYGGRTDAFRLLAPSDAIDTGAPECASFDQGFKPRPVGAACDIGAVERQ